MFDLDNLDRQIARMTDANDHNGAAVALATRFGTSKEIELLSEIEKRATRRGSGDHFEIQMRDYIVARILNRLRDTLSAFDWDKLHGAF